MFSASNYVYAMIAASRVQRIPFRQGVKFWHNWFANGFNPMSKTQSGQLITATLEMVERATRYYHKPEFGITETEVNGKIYHVSQKVEIHKPFCNLLHFKKSKNLDLPKLLIVAPMAGHHATLLKHTVRDLLPHFDVYITDWIGAKYVPIAEGSFNMDDYIDYLIEFYEFLSPEIHVMAVCQPTVPVLAATAIMSSNNSKYLPKSLVLIGGPVDARKNPTAVNSFATSKSIEWFERNLTSEVPIIYPGYGRQVYPGYIQIAGFVSMKLQSHIDSHIELYRYLFDGNYEAASKIKKFYDEYFAVMDLPAEFYLQTIKEVFHDFSLATGKLISRGRKVDLKAITKTALLGIEGERDDIAGVGQTKASLKLCSSIPEHLREYHLQKDVGHYGVFSGSKFKKFVVPVIKKFIYKHDKKHV